VIGAAHEGAGDEDHTVERLSVRADLEVSASQPRHLVAEDGFVKDRVGHMVVHSGSRSRSACPRSNQRRDVSRRCSTWAMASAIYQLAADCPGGLLVRFEEATDVSQQCRGE
jgi:hypothetical protein